MQSNAIGAEFFPFFLAYLSYLLPPPIQGKVIWGSGRFEEMHFKCESFRCWWNTENENQTSVELLLEVVCLLLTARYWYWPPAELEKFPNLFSSVTCTHIVTQTKKSLNNFKKKSVIDGPKSLKNYFNKVSTFGIRHQLLIHWKTFSLNHSTFNLNCPVLYSNLFIRDRACVSNRLPNFAPCYLVTDRLTNLVNWNMFCRRQVLLFQDESYASLKAIRLIQMNWNMSCKDETCNYFLLGSYPTRTHR